MANPSPMIRGPICLLLALAGTLACSDSGAPALSGPPFLNIAIDGRSVSGLTYHAGCGDFSFILIAAPLNQAIPDADVLEIRLAGLAHAGTYSLTDVGAGSFARAFALQPSGVDYQTRSAEPGRLTISAVSFGDSLVAGAFAFRLSSQASASTPYGVSGSFRLPLGSIFTVDHPEGTPCQAATP